MENKSTSFFKCTCVSQFLCADLMLLSLKGHSKTDKI